MNINAFNNIVKTLPPGAVAYALVSEKPQTPTSLKIVGDEDSLRNKVVNIQTRRGLNLRFQAQGRFEVSNPRGEVYLEVDPSGTRQFCIGKHKVLVLTPVQEK